MSTTTRWPEERVLYYRSGQGSPAKGASQARGIAPIRTTSASKRVHVGIWDMNTSAGTLPKLLAELEEKQNYFSFYNVVAPFQTGLTLPGPHVAAEWLSRTRTRMSRQSAAENVSAARIFDAAKPVLRQMPIDWLVVVVASMISDARPTGDSMYNLFATSKGRVVLVSAFDLRHYAAEAGRPFEVALLGCALSGLVAAMVPRVEYRNQSTGSIFDYCIVRHDIVKCIREAHVDEENRKVIPRKILEPTEQILDVLKGHSETATPAAIMRRRKMLATLKKRAVPTTARTKSTTPTATSVKQRQLLFGAALKALQNSLETSDPSTAAKTRSPARRSKKRRRAK